MTRRHPSRLHAPHRSKYLNIKPFVSYTERIGGEKILMSYEPKYCCQCGDKIERADRGFLTSRRFCELCETDFRHLDWMPKVMLAAAGFLTLVSLGLFFIKPEKSLIVSSNQPQNFSSSVSQNTAPPAQVPKQISGSTISQRANDNLTLTPKSANEIASVRTSNTTLPQNQPSAVTASETIYFCGAQTKKGTPCTRRVKGGGRCWQHTGQPAMLPQEKLIAN